MQFAIFFLIGYYQKVKQIKILPILQSFLIINALLYSTPIINRIIVRFLKISRLMDGAHLHILYTILSEVNIWEKN